MDNQQILIGGGTGKVFLQTRFANRHGLIAGATGTGKTVTMQVLAEQFSLAGVPVFLADVKGDLSGLCCAAPMHPKLLERAAIIGIKSSRRPPRLWSSGMSSANGPPPVAHGRRRRAGAGIAGTRKLLELNDTQEGILNIAFKVADGQGLLLLDLADLRSLLNHVAANRKALSAQFGLVSPQSVAAIQRRLLVLQQQGIEHFLGEPALDIKDLMRQDMAGRGLINVLASNQLFQHPRLYGVTLLWLLAELFEELPEIGDPEKPRLVFFFDEAHVLFDDGNRALEEQIEKVVRLIRSKGIGVFFVTQNPLTFRMRCWASSATASSMRSGLSRHAIRRRSVPLRLSEQSAARHRDRHHPARRRRSTGIDARGQGNTGDRSALPGSPAAFENRPGRACGSGRPASGDPVGGRYDHSVDRESAYEYSHGAREESP